MKKDVWIWVGVLIVVVVALFIFNSDNRDEVRIGVVLPLSGYIAELGNFQLDGFELALEDADPALSEKVKVIYEDNGGYPKETLSAINKLRSLDGVDFMIGPLAGSATRAAEEFARKNEVLFLSAGDNFGKTSDYFFSVSLLNAAEGRSVAEYMIAENKMTASVLYLENDWGVVIKDAFVEHYISLGGEILEIEGHSSEQVDFKSSLTKLTVNNPDAIFVGWAPTAVKQFKELGKNTTYYTGRAFESAPAQEAYKDYLEDVRYPYPVHNTGEEYELFEKRFIEKYDYNPPYFSAISYISMQIALEIVEKCGNDKECAKKLLIGSSRQTMLGEIAFTDEIWGYDAVYERRVFRDGVSVKNEV
ncbi:ABC transporter substrate-binding protein [archaeon]|jgi:branched-chain amino acid transport system substrate-binding protein|nr:ABC transporter substrate-binding protein [archaeon]MBT6820011.1 ABC transporter substrate-binding protein [archaeon]MBT6955727.1 ABC transporter substrate-binding protein [archaeon]MBT7238667.1 ABC transporter substrate-binding protein [archaeon]MBT7567818.1 ABC transporter substrate-binding protein [archaeon]